jgi:hypothetical protein
MKKSIILLILIIISLNVKAQQTDTLNKSRYQPNDIYYDTSGDVFVIKCFVKERRSNEPVSGKFFFDRDSKLYNTYNMYPGIFGECTLTVYDYKKEEFKKIKFKPIWIGKSYNLNEDYKFTRRKVRLYKYTEKPLILKVKKVQSQKKHLKFKNFIEDVKGELFSTIYPSFDLNIGRHVFSEVGITVSPGTYYSFRHPSLNRNNEFNYFIRIGTEFNYRRPFILGPKLSFHYKYFTIFESGVNSILYTDFNESIWVVRPETGFTLLEVLGIRYGYNFRISGKTGIDQYINRHNINLYIRLIL